MSKAAQWIDRASQQPGTRGLAAAAATIGKIIQTREWHWISYDRRGWWINRQRSGVLFSPTLHTGTLRTLAAQVDDFWCHLTPLRPGNVVVDIGAGVGDHVLVFSQRVGPRGRVVAVEAHPLTARCLRLTVEQNHLDNTVVLEEAAWNVETTLQISDVDAHEANAVRSGASGFSVRARPVDAMLSALQLGSIDLLKMNVEGAEATALDGMTATLAKTAAIVVSCHDFLATNSASDPRRTKAQVMQKLRAAGFTLTTRPDAPYAFMRDYVYGQREARSA